MAVIHRTTLEPTKLELLAAWLPSRPWYHGAPEGPRLARAGGFRLDDPRGEVGIEFLVATDASGSAPAAYLVPLTYRGAPLDGADAALVGTTEHGVLGRRWVYDACHDPVAVAELAALVEGRAEPQAQSASDTPDREVTRALAGEGPVPAEFPAVTDTGSTPSSPPRTARCCGCCAPCGPPGRHAAGGPGRRGPCRRGVGRGGRHPRTGAHGAAAHAAARPVGERPVNVVRGRAVTVRTRVPWAAGASLG